MDDSGIDSGDTEVAGTVETVEERRVAALVLTELARAAKAATLTLAVAIAVAWLFSGYDGISFPGPYDFPGRYLVALLPLTVVWFTLKGAAERLAKEPRVGAPAQGEAETS